VVNGSVKSTRVGATSAALGIQTFRTDGTTAVTNEIGGHKPALSDGVANAGTETLDTTNYKLSGGALVQSLQAVNIAGVDISGADFGFNFDTIVNTNDNGQGSLRQFIKNSNLLANTGLDQAANSLFDPQAGHETSIFMIPSTDSNMSSGVATITITSHLDSISASDTHLNGYTQAGAKPGAIGARDLKIRIIPGGNYSLFKLDSSANNTVIAGFNLDGFNKDSIHDPINSVNGASNLQVKGNYIGTLINGMAGTGVSVGITSSISPNVKIGVNLDNGAAISNDGMTDDQEGNLIGKTGIAISVSRQGGHIIAGNWLGVDASGVTKLANTTYGIYLPNVTSAQVGGTSPLQRNIISGSQLGLSITGMSASIEKSTNVKVLGNYVGVGKDGITAVPNTNAGIVVLDADQVQIGDGTAAGANVVSGNTYSGIVLDGYHPTNTPTTHVVIKANLIGVGADGVTARGNGRAGIAIAGQSTDNEVSYNTIANNASDGVEIALSMPTYLGTGTPINNKVLHNTFFKNGGLAIDLLADNVTINDSNDSDTGPNTLLNFPIFKTASSVNGQLMLQGCAPTGSTIELYEADVSPTSASKAAAGANKFGKTQDYGEGERYLTSLVEGVGEDTVTTPIDCANLTDTDSNKAVGMSPFQWTLTMPTDVLAGDKLTATATNSTDTSEFSAVVVVTAGHTLKGRIFEDVNYGGGAGRDLASAVGKGVNGATVELYKADGSYVGKTTTANDGTKDGVYTFNQVIDGNYYVRVVSDSVNSTRVGSDGTELGVQTFRTDGTTAVTNEVGGHNPSVADGVANSGTDTFDPIKYKLSGGAVVQNVQPITMAGADLSGIDFGFNFDTIVNTNDAGQGSLRQFILNSNLLGNTGLSQVGQTAGKEASIFMIADGNEHAGLAAGLVNGINGMGGNTGAAVISLSSDLTITASDTTLDATTQTQNVGDLNSGLIGTGGTVGVDTLALDKIPRPEIVLNAEFIPINTNAIIVQSDNVLLKGFAIYGYRSATLLNGAEKSTIVIDSTVSEAGSATVNQLFIGAMADGSNPHMPPSTISNGLAIVGAATVSNNYVAFNADGAEFLNASGVKVVFSNNELFDNGPKDNNSSNTSGIYADQIEISAGSQITIRGNLIRNSSKPNYTDAQGQGVQISSSGSILIDNNTFNDNNAWSVGGLANDALIRKNIITGTKKTGLGYGSGIRIKGLRNHITQNSIYQNTHLGIDLGDDIAITANDGSVDSSLANNGMDYPIVTSALLIGNNLSVTGFVGSAVGQSVFANATLEIFKAEDDGNNQGAVILGDGQSVAHGEGKTYLGTITAAANGSFNNTLTVTGLALNDNITLTATDANGNTSEFSPATLVTNGHTLTGRVFEDINYGGGAGRDLTTAAGKGVNGATVELYKADGSYVGKTTTANDGTKDGAYTFKQLVDGSYWVRVVNGSVKSTRVGATSAALGIQTFRTDGTTAVTNEIGGA
jgi:hypothetical protein